jgi:hypothetical protein
MRHELDEKGICWKVRTVKGDDAWILCGRASYEAVTRCDEHNEPLATTARPAPAGKESEEV